MECKNMVFIEGKTNLTMEIAVTKMSSKGQIVIPLEMRKEFREGDKLLLLKGKGSIILRKASSLDEKLKEDLEFARRTDEAIERYERGEFIEMEGKDFLKELETW
jgi:AbrB family looped-hinge helix DNA binding protein